MIVLGLTGGIATGKSTVAKIFVEARIPHIDADVIAREVVEVGMPAYQKIVAYFGQEILAPNGAINRKRLGEIIFQDEAKRQILNGIVHPEVYRVCEERLKSLDTQFALLDVPLLFEANFDKLCDYILVVYTNLDIQIERLMNRDCINREEALLKIKAQMPLEIKMRLADFTIDNSGSLEHTRWQIHNLLDYLRQQGA